MAGSDGDGLLFIEVPDVEGFVAVLVPRSRSSASNTSTTSPGVRFPPGRGGWLHERGARAPTDPVDGRLASPGDTRRFPQVFRPSPADEGRHQRGCSSRRRRRANGSKRESGRASAPWPTRGAGPGLGSRDTHPSSGQVRSAGRPAALSVGGFPTRVQGTKMGGLPVVSPETVSARRPILVSRERSTPDIGARHPRVISASTTRSCSATRTEAEPRAPRAAWGAAEGSWNAA